MPNLKQVVVVIENDISLLKAIGRLIFAMGYEVETYISAELFLDRKHRKAVDCLLLDINLDGMSGLELQKTLRNRQLNYPVIFISGRDDEQTIGQAIDQHCAAYLHKPFDSHALQSVLANLLGEP
jgi:FixJ family two-component response regulator